MRQIANILERFLRKKGLANQVHTQLFLENWNTMIGEPLAQHSKARAIINGKLFINVDHPGWMQQLKLLKPTILAKIKSDPIGARVKDIVFRMGETK